MNILYSQETSLDGDSSIIPFNQCQNEISIFNKQQAFLTDLVLYQ